MKKLLATLVVALGFVVGSEAIKTVVVSNVVTAKQSDDARFAYKGRTNEIVRNKQNGGLTIFDNETVGGISVIRPMDFYVTSPNGAAHNTDALVMGQRLKATVAKANALATNKGSRIYYPVRVVLDAGTYTITNGIEVAANVQLVSRVFTDYGIGESAYNSLDQATPGKSVYPSVSLRTPDGSTVVTYITNGIAYPDRQTFCRGIQFYDSVEAEGMANEYFSISAVGCLFREGLFTNSVTQISAYLENCIIDGPVGYMATDNVPVMAIIANRCLFTDESTIRSVRLNSGVSGLGENSNLSRFTACLFNGKIEAVYSKQVYSTPQFINCTIDGSNAFTEDGGAAGISYIGQIRNCEILNTSTNEWWPTAASAQRDAVEISYTTGIDGTLTNSSATILYCTDADGNLILNN